MRKKLYWWKDEPNFGDAASKYLLDKLILDKVVWAKPQTRASSKIKEILKAFLGKRKLPTIDIRGYVYPWSKCLFGIGSILDDANYKTIVWGSGYREFTSRYKKTKILAVRGQLSLNKLPTNIDNSTVALGDPALLLPIVYDNPIRKTVKVKIVPHFVELEFFTETYGDRYEVIDVRTVDVERIIDQIRGSEYILSTSLHGIIVAQAYGIPALWIRKGYINSSEFKFYDYFSSVDIPKYDGFTDLVHILSSEQSIVNLFIENNDKSIIRASIREIQRGLLEVFPYNMVKGIKMKTE